MKMLKITNDFIDKAPVCLPTDHRFYDLSVKINAYQGSDICLYANNNELPTGLTGKQAAEHDEDLLEKNPLPQACVLVAITDEPNPRLLLTRRSNRLSSHAGEVSFVGGKRDEVDKSSVDVALREAYEEVGLDGLGVDIIGYLPMQISKKGLLVRPVVVSIPIDAVDKIMPNDDEIARVFWLPFELLKTAPTNYVFDGQLTDQTAKLHTLAWVYDVNNDGMTEIIWGLTGRILANLMKIGFGLQYEWYYRIVKQDGLGI